MVLLQDVRQASKILPISVDWLLSSEINVKVGIVSGRRLIIAAIDHLFDWKQKVIFMATCQETALAQIQQQQPGILVITPDLQHGASGILMLVQAHDLAADLCSILIVDLVHHDLNLAYHSKAKAVISEQEIFCQSDCLARMIRTLALGKIYPLTRTRGLHGRPEKAIG